jgi:hypothetical protein
MRYGVDTLPHVRYVLKRGLGVYWRLVDKISPACLRVEKFGCASSPAGLVTPGLFVHPSNRSGAGASARLVATEATHSSYLCVAPPGQSPAYSYLKQRLQPLQIFNQKI